MAKKRPSRGESSKGRSRVEVPQRGESRPRRHDTADTTSLAQSSIEISRDAKQVLRWTVKIYFDQDEEGADDRALAKALALDNELRGHRDGEASD